MAERITGIVVAHPDDAETMLGYSILNQTGNTHVFVATDGEKTTINRTGIAGFCHNGNRRNESEQGLVRLGVPLERQHYFGLPDGECERYTPDITKQITATAKQHGIDTLVTLGKHGYDGHQDHTATHKAAVLAADNIQTPVEIYALNHQHTGEHVLYARPALRRKKLGAMAYHASQFNIRPADGAVPQDTFALDGFAIAKTFWREFQTYHPLIMQGETYNRR